MRFVMTSHKGNSLVFFFYRPFLLTEPLITLSDHITGSRSLDIARIINCEKRRQHQNFQGH